MESETPILSTPEELIADVEDFYANHFPQARPIPRGGIAQPRETVDSPASTNDTVSVSVNPDKPCRRETLAHRQNRSRTNAGTSVGSTKGGRRTRDAQIPSQSGGAEDPCARSEGTTIA